MRVHAFLVIDGFASCTPSFPLLEKKGEKRTLREGYAPSLRTLLQVETLRSSHNRKERAPAEATPARLFWRIRTALFNVSSPRRKTSDLRFGLRFLTVIERLRKNVRVWKNRRFLLAAWKASGSQKALRCFGGGVGRRRVGKAAWKFCSGKGIFEGEGH